MFFRHDGIPPAIQKCSRIHVGPAIGSNDGRGPVRMREYYEREIGPPFEPAGGPHFLRQGRAIEHRTVFGIVRERPRQLVRDPESLFFVVRPKPPSSTLFPYTTLFR